MNPIDGETGLVVFAHGSRVEKANQGVRDLAAQVQSAGPYNFVVAVFLELGQPDLSGAIAQAAAADLRRVIVIPYFLTDGLHLQRDLPRLIEPLRRKYPALEIDVGQSLEGHPMMPSIILDRAQEAIEAGKVATRTGLE